MTHVTIFGGHGKVAMRVARILADRGDGVSAVIRNPEQGDDVVAAGAEPVVLDVERADVDEIAAILEGSDAVVWSAGAGGGDPERTYAVDRDAAIRSMDAAQQAGVERYVMVSYLGAGPDHGVPEGDSFFPYAEAKGAADQYLEATGLKWTILAPGRLTDEPGGETIGVGDHLLESRETSRDAVANVICAVLHRPDTVDRTIGFTDGDTPIGEAITRE